MGVYRASQAARAGVNTANTVYWELRGSTTERLYIREFGIFVSTATTSATTWQLVRNANSPTSTGTLTIAPVDVADSTATATAATTWSTAPTAGAVLWTGVLPVTAGSGYVWVAPTDRDRIVIPATAGAGVNWLASATGATVGAFSFYVVWEE